uniref:Paralemmin 3 n=1 Tax=Sphaeramia orbicularis TaxID=375764 RepID=A0A673CVZ6_9TELE
RMDETEKYKQRLEAIAEKRRLQEEQDRARREMEDERLRLQQLKRKSLRDQWLMEGAPLSPTSLEAPRSPLWGSQAQEIEKNIDKLQSESQRLAEEEEKLKEQMEDGQTVRNFEISLDEPAAVLTNGGNIEVETSPSVSAQEDQSNTNGPIVDTKGVVGMMSSPGFSEAESGQVPNININEEEEEEEGTMVIRAECVIITDEGDDVPEDSKPQENEQTMPPEETPLPNQDGVETEETVTESEKSEARSVTTEEQPQTGGGDMEGDVEPNENGTEEDDKSEAPTSVLLLSPAEAQEGATVASVPVYSETQPSVTITEVEAEPAQAPEGAEAALKPQEPVTVEFQEIPLAEPKGNQRTGDGPGEQEPLLSQVKAPETQAAAAGSTPETPSPNRVAQGDDTKAPKRKTCQCCSVM